MAKGVKKIKLSKATYIKGTYTDKAITLIANSPAQFVVGEWINGTTEKDVANGITWIWQDQDRNIIINQFQTGSYDKAKIEINKKFAGPYKYYLEASLGGKRDSGLVGLYINAQAPKKIIASKWCVSNDGKDVRKTQIFNYGEKPFLNLDTEGLNGATLAIEIYNIQKFRSDKKIFTFTNVIVTDGEVNLEIKNTSQWQGLVNNIQDIEEFYVKVKIQGTETYILDDKKDDEHGRFLRIKNKLVANNPLPPKNNVPLKVGQPNVKATRYEPCKFEQINITETEKKDGKSEQKKVLIFDNGKGLVGKKGPQQSVTQSIYFEFDKQVIDKKSNEDLNNILKFLLDHENSTITLTGYACVIGRQNHNNILSQNRAEEIKKFFINGGLKSDRIIAQGKGEVNATDDKAGADNLKYKNEKDYINNRRVDISFMYEGHSAQTIEYVTIAPSSPKDILIDVSGHANKACYAKPKHTKKITVKSSFLPGNLEKNGSSMVIPVKSSLAALSPIPLQYIWPRWNLINGALGNKIDSASLYNVHVNTCRYFSKPNDAVILIKAYPDIKWTLEFKWNHKQPFAYT